MEKLQFNSTMTGSGVSIRPSRFTNWDQVRTRFTENWRGFSGRYELTLCLLVLAVMADAVSTTCFMLEEGVDAELHPLVKALAYGFGPFAGPLLGAGYKVVIGIILGIYWRPYAWYLFAGVIVVSIWAAWYNLWGSFLYEPNIISLYHWFFTQS